MRYICFVEWWFCIPIQIRLPTESRAVLLEFRRGTLWSGVTSQPLSANQCTHKSNFIFLIKKMI